MKLLPRNIGILAYMGPFMNHKQILEKMDLFVTLVKNKTDLESVDALIIPGTEVASLHFALEDMLSAIKARTNEGMPLLLTGEACVLLNEEEKTALSEKRMKIEKFSNPDNKRFNEELRLTFSDTRHFNADFVRSPKITHIAKGYKVLADKETDGEEAVMIEKENIIACTFYPEFNSDPRIHEYFITKI